MKSKDPDPYEALRQRLYEAQSLKCQDNVHAAQQEFDKAILTLSAGLLGLSLAFIKDVVPLAQAIALWLLYSSWCFSAGAILLTLFSFVASKKAFNAQLGELYREYSNDDQGVQPTRAALVTRWLTYGEGICFVVALALTVTFAILNVENSGAMLGENREDSATQMHTPSPKQVPVKKGVEPAQVIRVPNPRPAQQPPATPKRGGK